MVKKRSNEPGRRGQFAPLTREENAVRSRPGEKQSSALALRERSKWDEEARRIIRAEMQRRGVTFDQLVELVNHPGETETEKQRNLISRISRGTFSFGFAIKLLRAMGVRTVDISEVSEPKA